MALNNIFVKEGKKSYDGTTLVPQKIDYNKMPNCIYTFPEVVSVGLTEEECKKVKSKIVCKFKKVIKNEPYTPPYQI
ncbi:hypothetical protein [Spiroplasma sp. AdecLV25b]|uniref:hypothetical protein n=1 Tax=Spiroplasma sp. AdecLV25b TaxID=3027162 RepID=UPI0027E20647|nr:hypothetical protein [Spiroplasma sp. AdecLV25b]